jgi:hypothetical protein
VKYLKALAVGCLGFGVAFAAIQAWISDARLLAAVLVIVAAREATLSTPPRSWARLWQWISAGAVFAVWWSVEGTLAGQRYASLLLGLGLVFALAAQAFELFGREVVSPD